MLKLRNSFQSKDQFQGPIRKKPWYKDETELVAFQILVKTLEMWCLRVLFSQTIGSPKRLRVWGSQVLPIGLGKLKGIVYPLSQQKSMVEKNLSPRNTGVWFLPNRVNPKNFTGDPQKFWEYFYQQKLPVKNGRDRYRTKWKKAKDPQNSTGQSRLRKHSCRHILSFIKREGWLREWNQ